MHKWRQTDRDTDIQRQRDDENRQRERQRWRKRQTDRNGEMMERDREHGIKTHKKKEYVYI